MAVLEEAMQAIRQAADLLPGGDLEAARVFDSLGILLGYRYSRTGL